MKLYFLNLKGAVKEIRRTALHLKPNWEHWPTVYRMVSNMFSLAEATMTYEDPEKDKVHTEHCPLSSTVNRPRMPGQPPPPPLLSCIGLP